MFPYPKINPVALKLGPIKIHWYGIMYLLSFIVGGLLINYRAKKFHLAYTTEQVIDLVFYAAIGVILGGRIGYMLFYDFNHFLLHPMVLFEVWHGGMSFHGGLLGVIFMMGWWSYREKKSFVDIMDFIAPIAPVGLAAGRLGNFINGYLLGRVTHVPWATVYPLGGPWPRHPISLYEFLLEGVALFLILWFYSAKPKPRFAVSGMFLLFYGAFRFFLEFFRQPDPQLGFIAWGWLTMGQLLTFPMILGGIFLVWWAYREK